MTPHKVLLVICLLIIVSILTSANKECDSENLECEQSGQSVGKAIKVDFY